MKAAIYLRVSTGEQTTENQRLELEAWAKRAGHEILGIYEDNGISGAKGRTARPAFDRLLKDATRRRFDVIATHVDRLGRSLQDLVAFLNEIHAAGVDLYIHAQAIDTTTPGGKALFQMLGVFAEFERSIIQERIRAGLARAREKGTRSGKPIGRPKVAPGKKAHVRRLLAQGAGIRKAARKAGVGVSVAQAVAAEARVYGSPA